jgi:hypothetical protein
LYDGFGLGKRPAYWHYKRQTASNDRYEAFRIIFHDLLLDLPVIKWAVIVKSPFIRIPNWRYDQYFTATAAI